MKLKEYHPDNDYLYNADDVNFRMQHLRMADLIAMVDSYKLDLFENDEELSNCLNAWNNKRKSLFIESLMIKIPVPLFYIDGSQPLWKMIDGIKRLFAVHDFIHGKYRLEGLQYLKAECERDNFSSLYEYLKSRIMDAEVMVYIINPGTPQNVRYNIYQRLNLDRRGIIWNKIQHVFFRELSTEFFKPLAESRDFKEISERYDSSSDWENRKFVMRFAAFSIFGYERYNGDIQSFISSALLILKNEPSYLEELHYRFRKGADWVRYLFHDKNEMNIMVSPERMLDAWMWNISELSDKEYDLLVEERIPFLEEYKSYIINNRHFLEPQYTNSTSGVKQRFGGLRQLIKKYIE